MRIDDDFKWTYYPIIFAIVFIVFLVLNYFNLTLGLNIQDLIKIDILITLLIGQYFENREWFKTVFLIMISLALLMVFVDFLEKKSLFWFRVSKCFTFNNNGRWQYSDCHGESLVFEMENGRSLKRIHRI